MIPKKIPYGLSNFADLIESGYAYVDKTRYIELLENENNRYQFLIRPRRFGKSLFLTMLENYYDLLRIDSFNHLFKNLYIGKNPTSEHNSYAVLHFDFSGLNTDSHEEFKISFSARVEDTVRSFLFKYKEMINNSDFLLNSIYKNNLSIGALDIAYNVINSSPVKIFVFIDEYDHFANNLIAMGQSYKNEINAGGIVRSFYELLKIGAKSAVRRIFITGTSPMMLNDLTSGFNISTDYSLFPKYNEMFGFTNEEVEWILNETKMDKNLIKINIESYYNGYLFNNKAENRVYNPQMILYLFNQIFLLGGLPDNIVDANLQIDYERLRRLAEDDKNREKLLEIAKNEGIFGDIIEKFSIEKLNNNEYFLSLLFYLGMLTNGGKTKGRNWLKIPNYSIKTLYWEYIINYLRDSGANQINTNFLSNAISKMAYEGNFKTYLDIFTEDFLKRLSNRDLLNFDEKYIKVMILSTLFMSRLYLPISEDENINGYTDIYLQKHPVIKDIKYEYIFEIKYIKSDTGKKDLENAFSSALEQLKRYKKDKRYINNDYLKFIAIIFRGKGKYFFREID